MNKELEKIRGAWDKRPMKGLDSSVENADTSGDNDIRKMADAYVEKHPEEFDGLRDKTIDECVKAVDVFRSAGMEDEQWRVEVWLLHHFEPQNIGGTYHGVVRVTNG